MNCPVCEGTLREVQKHGVHVDICPSCKGVWLDRGELEKIIELVSSDSSNIVKTDDRPSDTSALRKYDDDEYEHRERQSHNNEHDRSYGKHKKKRSWFGEIFDVGD